ncbi:MAG: SMC-Scp complex subunit ScpB [Chloroflexota bacterium]
MSDEEQLSNVALLESVLFVASGSVPLGRLGKALGVSLTAVRNLLETLEADYETRGLRLLWDNTGVQLTTAPQASTVVERFIGLEYNTRLSNAALEALAIIGYMQPVTRPQIDQIRGVNSDGALRTLLSKGLIEEAGRMETPGRPILYATTTEFLQSFGLSSIDDLPILEDPED